MVHVGRLREDALGRGGRRQVYSSHSPIQDKRMPHSLKRPSGESRVSHIVRVGMVAFGVAIVATHSVRERRLLLRERLLSALSCRASPGRVVGEESHREWQAHRCDIEQDFKRALTLESSQTLEQASQLDSAVIDLLRGDTERAIAGFELASRVRGTAVEALTDLSAAYLRRAASEDDCLDALRAVHAAERGLTFAPQNPALLFNRATALSVLGTRATAAAAWQQFLAANEHGGWRDEAIARLQQTHRPTIDDEWQLVRARIQGADVRQEDVQNAISRFPANARTFAEEQLLPEWAARSAVGDTVAAEKSLALASAIGSSLRHLQRDELLDDAVSSIRRTMANGSAGERAALMSGLRDFGAGVVQYNEQNLTSAEGPLTRSAAALARAGNPLQFWARFYLAISEYYRDATRGLAMLDRLLTEVAPARYPALSGRIEWIAGTADKVQGRIQSSIARYERAEENLRRAGGDSAAAFVAVLLAESYTGLGEYSMAWEKRRTAFRNVPFSEGPRRNIAMWTEAKAALVHQGRLALGGPLLDEAVADAETWGRPLGRTSAYLDRAAYRIEVGRREGAFADLRRATDAIAHMEQSGLRNQMSYIALVTEGLLYRSSDPARAAALLRKGLQEQRATGTDFEAISYTTTLAEAELANGDTATAASTLERALAIFESIRSTVEDPVSRMQAFRQAQPAFDRLIELRATQQGSDPEAAFLVSERSRARVLLDLQRNGQPPRRDEDFIGLAALAQLVPRRIALASYAVLPSAILVWVVEDGRARQVILRENRGEIEGAIERFRLEIARGADTSVLREASAPLYDALIRPLGLSCNADCGLVVIPDRRLAQLPFAALFDRLRGEYLIEQRTVAIAPSATLLARGITTKKPADRGALLPALVLGISQSGTYRGRNLPTLLEAVREATRVAKLYPGSALLTGSAATRENFRRLSLSTSVIHFAGHAVADLEAPRRSVLLFADASGNTLQPLSLGELFDARPSRPDLVVLSACRTQDGLGDDREGMLGLAGAFVAAGVAEVLASPLDVDDRAAASLMIAFHRHYQHSGSAATAFRDAVLDLMRNGSSEARSPAAWGRFSVIEGSIEGATS